jgi:hypothetical protein
MASATSAWVKRFLPHLGQVLARTWSAPLPRFLHSRAVVGVDELFGVLIASVGKKLGLPSSP